MGRDVGGSGAPARAPHTSPALVAVVALGGALGTAGRVGVAALVPEGRPADGAWPWATSVVNVAGALLLGALLEALARRGEDVGARRTLRLGLGTGLLGSFTTWSALAVGTDRLLGAGATAAGLAYPLLSLLAGAAAAAAGVLLAAAHHRRRRRRLAVDPDAPSLADAPSPADEAGPDEASGQHAAADERRAP